MLIIEVSYNEEARKQRNGKKGLLIVVLAPDNMQRMKQADPVILKTETYPKLSPYRLQDLEVMICDEDPTSLFNLADKPADPLKHLMRGYKELPGDGMVPIPFKRPS